MDHNIYCSFCNIYQKKTGDRCIYCDNLFTDDKDLSRTSVYINICAFPYKEILQSFKSLNIINLIISLPIISIIYFFKRLFKKPFFIKYKDDIRPRLHILKNSPLPSCENDRYSSWLLSQGFAFIYDIDDKSNSQRTIFRYFYNSHHSHFALLCYQDPFEEPVYSGFYAFTEGSYIYFYNNHGIELKLPDHIRIQHISGVSIQTLYEEFREKMKFEKIPLAVTFSEMLIEMSKISLIVNKLSAEQGFAMLLSDENNEKLTLCSKHSTRPAIRKCDICDIFLCESCIKEGAGGGVYCSDCQPEKNYIPIPSIDEGFSFPGLTLRTASFIIDITLCLTGGFLLFYLSNALLVNPALSFILGQSGFTALFLYIQLIHTRRYGGTIGNRLLGISIIDKSGNTPEIQSLFIRLAYLIFSLLFIIPFLGYLFILFGKSHQGIHDRLAEIFHITKRKRIKEVLIWVLLIFVVFSAYNYGKNFLYEVIYHFHHSGTMPVNIALNPVWEKSIFDHDPDKLSIAIRGNIIVWTSPNGLQALEIETGAQVWKRHDLKAVEIPSFNSRLELPIAILDSKDNGNILLKVIDAQNGRTYWKSPSEFNYQRFLQFNEGIIIISNNYLYFYDWNGNRSWRKEISEKEIIYSLEINDGILIESIIGNRMTSRFLSLISGEILWEQESAYHRKAISLKNGIQLFHSSYGEIFLKDLKENQIIWKTQSNGEYANNHIIDVHYEEDILAYIFTYHGILDGKTGEMIREFPSEAVLQYAGNRFVLFAEGSKVSIMEKDNLEIILKITVPDYEIIQIFDETENYLYLFSLQIHQINGDHAYKCHLIRINIQDIEDDTIEVFYLGENLLGMNPLKNRILADDSMIFLYTDSFMGVYELF